jgi:ABC-type sulfate/molybdate transport systems ATPase subunit
MMMMMMMYATAVDAHVGQHLFEECILHLQRRGKCVLFVTNALQFVKTSSHIVVLKDGHVSECGTYQQLLQSNKGFSEMINTMSDTGSSGSNKATRLSPSPSSSNVLKDPNLTGDSNTAMVSNPLHGTSSSSSSSSSIQQPVPIGSDSDSKVSIKKSASLITEEDRQHGDVSMQVYYTWARAAGGISVGR